MEMFFADVPNFYIVSLVMVTIILDIVHAGFLEISYIIPFMTCKVMDIYQGEYLSNILLYTIRYITTKCRMYV
jgi:hypothetical protein